MLPEGISIPARGVVVLSSLESGEADHGLVKQGAVSGPSSSVDLKALPERRNMRELCKDLMRNI